MSAPHLCRPLRPDSTANSSFYPWSFSFFGPYVEHFEGWDRSIALYHPTISGFSYFRVPSVRPSMAVFINLSVILHSGGSRNWQILIMGAICCYICSIKYRAQQGVRHSIGARPPPRGSATDLAAYKYVKKWRFSFLLNISTTDLDGLLNSLSYIAVLCCVHPSYVALHFETKN